MNYINISTHKFVGRNNQQLTKKLSLDFELTNVIQFQFINSNNQILDIDSSNLYLAGAIIPDYSNSKVIFYSNNYTYDSDTKTLTFTIDTFTENYAKYIKRPDHISFLEIGKNARENILCFDTIVCQPRIYTPETPSPEHLDEYYTMDEADARFASLSAFEADVANLSANYWTKYETAQAIANVQTMEIVVVEELPPVEDAQEYTIYLIPSTDQEIGNVYDEYLVINHNYEKIGSTAIDLSQYYTKDEADANFFPVTGGIVSGDVTCNALNVSGNIVANGGLSASGITVNGTDINSLYFPLTGGTVNGNVNVNGNLKISNLHGLAFQNSSSYANSIAIGYNAKTEGPYSLALGYSALARYEGELCIGYTPTSGHVGYGLIICKGTGNRSSIGLRYTNGTLEVNDNIIAAGSLTASGAIFTGPVSETGDLYLGGGLSGEVTSLNLKLNYDNQLVNVLSKGVGYNLTLGNSNYNMSLPCVNLGITTSSQGHVSLNGHQENTSGGFVIQDLSGKITADYLEATSGLTASGAIFTGPVQIKPAGEYNPKFGLIIGGPNAEATGQCTLAVGWQAKAKGGYSLALGHSAVTRAEAELCIGYRNDTLAGHTSYSITVCRGWNGSTNDLDTIGFRYGNGTLYVTNKVDVDGHLQSYGSLLSPATTTTITPKQGIIYTRTLEANDTFTIETPMSGYSPTFELWLTQPDTAVNFSFTTNISWDDGTGHISSNNTRPPMNIANTTYCIVLRWTGTRWIGNLAYIEDVNE